jgi:hypothetical protein
MALSVRGMNPAALRAAILVTELLVFFITTALTVNLLSHAGALEFNEGDAPPPAFPVVAYDGDRGRPSSAGYLVVPWSDWEATAGKRPGASLLLPERAATLRFRESEASFVATEERDARQDVALTWRSAGDEHHVRYVAQARTLSPRYYRKLGVNTFLVGAIIGFIAGLYVGRVLRRRWLSQPGYFAPPSQRG